MQVAMLKIHCLLQGSTLITVSPTLGDLTSSPAANVPATCTMMLWNSSYEWYWMRRWGERVMRWWGERVRRRWDERVMRWGERVMRWGERVRRWSLCNAIWIHTYHIVTDGDSSVLRSKQQIQLIVLEYVWGRGVVNTTQVRGGGTRPGLSLSESWEKS